MTPLEIRPTDGVGAQVVGVDLTATTVGEWNQIEAAFAAFGVLVFRDQIMTDDDFVTFAERWGSVLYDTPVDPRGWHGGRSYVESPTACSVIRLNRQVEGLTLKVSSMYAAFDTLSSGTQQALEALHAVHTSGSETATHPLVIRHPISGRKVLFLNPASTTSIVGMNEAEGLELLNELCAHCLLPEFATELSVEPGTVVLLDHRAALQYRDPTVNEALSTLRIVGEPLAPAFRPAKADPSLTQRAGATLAGGIITAAMIGIADVLDPEKRTHDIEIVSDAPEREPLNATLDFGDLPPLD